MQTTKNCAGALKAEKNGKGLQSKVKNNISAIFLAVALIAIWQILAMVIDIPHIFPSPGAILRRGWELRNTLFLTQLPVTLRTIAEGWALSIAIAAVLAVIMDFSKIANAMLSPFLIVTQTIPVMCISPLFVLWFGYTQTARLTAVVLSTFFAITLNISTGFKRTDKEKIELMRSLGASPFQIFIKLKIPSAFPLFVTSLKMTLPWAVIDAAVAEWLGATQGLGAFSKRMISKMDGPAVFAPVIILTVIALLGMGLMDFLDRKAAWYRSETDS